MKIVVTIPAYNEEKDISRVIKDIKSNVKEKVTVLVVDDGSNDNTVKAAKKAGAIVVSNKRNIGLVGTFKREMEECLKLKADIIVHTDADGQYPAKFIPLLIKKVKSGSDLVLGTRFDKGSYSGSMMKKIGNKLFAKVFSNMLHMKITDTTTGFRAFTPEVARLPLINRFTYTQEQLIRARKYNFEINEIPIVAESTRESRLFKNSFDYAVKAGINLIRIYRDFEPLKFFGIFGTVIFSTGFLIGIYLVYLHFTSGIVGHFALIVLDILILSIGLQIIIFGFIADMLKKD
jgi:glycosyltransferase involved in cell wall biosynthesis